MFMAIADRIKHLRKQAGLTQTELGERLGVKKNAVSKWECGRVEDIPSSKIKAMAELFGVKPSYFIDESEPQKVNIPAGFEPLPETQQVPLVGSIACGTPILAEQNIEAYVPVLTSWRADFALTCKGQSMEPLFKDGDLVAIRKQPMVDQGQVAAVRIGEEATLKRVYLHPEYIELRPENTAFASIMKIREEMNEVVIEGLAVGICRGLA
jgi:repressor LexA